jgi:hypothetical protein
MAGLIGNQLVDFNLRDLTNIDITSPSNGASIVWNETLQKWEDNVLQVTANDFTTILRDKLTVIEDSATADQTAAEIKALYEAEANAFTDALFTKLGTVETNAKDDQTGAEIKALYEAQASAFTDALFTKLGGIETGATADLTGAEIKALYEAEVDSFTAVLLAKLNGIEDAATADQTDAEIKTAVEAGTDIALAGNPTTTTQTPLDNSTKIATTAYADAAVATLVDAAPAALDTLNELAAALGDDANYATTTAAAIGEKMPLAGGAFTGAVTTNSTFDGRSVAVDGTKLDGIEALADVTDTTNVTAAGAAMLTGATFTGAVTSPSFNGPMNGPIELTGKNTTGTTLLKGQAVYVSGISGTTLTVGLADANDVTKMPAVGLLSVDAVNDATVGIVTFGSLTDVQTNFSGWSLGDSLYVSESTGYLTNTAPSGETSQIQNLGLVSRVDVTAGVITVSGAGRASDTPNLNIGNVFIGDSNNQAQARSLTIADTAGLQAALDAAADQTDAEIKTAVENSVDIALAGSPTTTTQATADNSTKIATTAYADNAVAALVDSSPSALNTLNELAAALGDDANYAATTASLIGTKMPLSGGAFSGAVTTNSTFDGRDVAVDGTKLDGIETAATADQTGAEIKALYEAEADAFTDVLLAKLNGIEALADVTDTTNVTAAGALMLTGGAMTGTIELGPTHNVEFVGTGSSAVPEITVGAYASVGGLIGATGTMRVYTGDKFLVQSGSAVKTSAEFDPDAAVTLNHNNATKLATTATGIEVTGSAVISGDLTVQGTTTSVNSTVVELGDNIITLNSGETGTPSVNGGFEIERGTSTNVSFVWNETDDAWDMGTNTLQNVIIDGGTF